MRHVLDDLRTGAGKSPPLLPQIERPSHSAHSAHVCAPNPDCAVPGLRMGPLLVKIGGCHDGLHGTRTASQYMYPNELFEPIALRLVSGHNNSIESAAAEEWCIRWWKNGTLT